MPKLIIDKKSFDAFSPEDQKAFKEIKGEGDAPATYEAGLTLTTKFHEATDKLQEATEKLKGSDKKAELPESLQGKSKDDLDKLAKEHKDWAAQIEAGKLKGDEEVAAYVDAQIKDASAENKATLEAVKAKLEESEGKLLTSEHTRLNDSKINAIMNAISKVPTSEIVGELDDVQGRIKQYLPDDPSHNYFLALTPDQEGNRAKLRDDSGENMNPETFAKRFIESHPSYFKPVEGVTDLGSSDTFESSKVSEMTSADLYAAAQGMK